MRFIMALIWALLIGAALAYVLTSMAEEPFNMTQSLVFSAIVFLAVLLLDGILTTQKQK